MSICTVSFMPHLKSQILYLWHRMFAMQLIHLITHLYLCSMHFDKRTFCSYSFSSSAAPQRFSHRRSTYCVEFLLLGGEVLAERFSLFNLTGHRSAFLQSSSAHRRLPPEERNSGQKCGTIDLWVLLKMDLADSHFYLQDLFPCGSNGFFSVFINVENRKGVKIYIRWHFNKGSF